MPVTREAVVEKLKTVNGPDFSGNIVDLGLVSEIFIADSKVFFSIPVPAARAQELEPLRAAAERAVKAIPGVAGAVVALTAEKKGGGSRSPGRPWMWVAVGLLAGGAIGTLVDRVRLGHVTDFIDLPPWPPFNLADVAITFGVILLVILYRFDAGAEAKEGGAEQDSG